MPRNPMQLQRYGVREQVICPHCWERFAPEKMLWISEHQDLLGDPRLGPEHSLRFLPTRFTVDGAAIDARGFACHQLACASCHLPVPRPFLEMEPLFLSIFGAPASGKSYLLAAMSWELRKVLPLRFATSFTDADPVANQILNGYEESLFSNAKSDDLVPLLNLIRKTEEQGDLYDMVTYGSQPVSYPRPFVFAMQPQAAHPNASRSTELGRVICLYDNAGESFQPGKDSTAAPVTRHMAHSRMLFFVFDPTQDSRFRKRCNERLDARSAEKISRQEPILQEAAARIRRYSGLKQSEKHKRPLVVIVTKCDAWLHLTGESAADDPWRSVASGKVGSNAVSAPAHALDRRAIDAWSERIRNLLLESCPEIVTAAENLCSQVTYIPVSAVGWKARVDEDSGMLSIRPQETAPYWVTIPFLYAASQAVPGLIPLLVRKSESSGSKTF